MASKAFSRFCHYHQKTDFAKCRLRPYNVAWRRHTTVISHVDTAMKVVYTGQLPVNSWRRWVNSKEVTNSPQKGGANCTPPSKQNKPPIPLRHSRRCNPPFRGLLERICQLEEPRFAARHPREAHTVWARFRVEALRHRRAAGGLE